MWRRQSERVKKAKEGGVGRKRRVMEKDDEKEEEKHQEWWDFTITNFLSFLNQAVETDIAYAYVQTAYTDNAAVILASLVTATAQFLCFLLFLLLTALPAVTVKKMQIHESI